MSPPPSAAAQSGLDWDAIASALAGRMQLEAGERVLLVALPGRFDPLVPRLRQHIVAAGGEDLGAVATAGEAPAGWETEFTRSLAGLGRQQLTAALADVDVGIMMPGPSPADAVYAVLQELLPSGRRRTVHFHWAGAYELNGATRSIDSTVDALYTRALLATDHDALATTQQRFEAAMRDADIRVTTPAGTDLRFRIGVRPVTRQDGDASAARARAALNLVDREVELPAGAIRVAPVETTVDGAVAFPDADWNGERVEGLVIRFRAGKITTLTADRGLDAVEAVLRRGGESARSFREFALGFNRLLAIPERQPWIPYYGYGAGVVRLSLGDNTELGGNVGGGFVRWNFFTDATVVVDGTTWVREGRLTDPGAGRD